MQMSCSSLALALLAEVFSTLGQPPPAVAGLALLAEEATELRARRGAAAAERALRSLQAQGHTDRLIALGTATDLFTAATPAEAAAEGFAEQQQLQLAAVACLTQIAATEPGARLLLDSRLLEMLATAGSNAATATPADRSKLAAPVEQQLPALRLVQALVASLPEDHKLAAHLAGLLRAKARSMRDLLLLTERTAAAVAGAGAAAALLSHACQPEYYEHSRRVAGPEVVTVLTQCAVALLVELGSHPYPKGLLPVQRQARCANGYLRRVPAAGAGAAADWWSTVAPVTAAEQDAAQVPCTLPPGAVTPGSSSSSASISAPEVDWTLFHASLLQTVQAALGHAAALFRVAAAAAPGHPLLREQFTGLGAALNACTQLYRATGAGAAEELGIVSSSSSSVFDAAAAVAAAAAAVDTSGYDTLPFSAAFVVESLLAGLHSEVAARSTDILESDTEALYAPLEALARETSPYVSKAARCILELLNPNPAA
jgi:hypothetical protein